MSFPNVLALVTVPASGPCFLFLGTYFYYSVYFCAWKVGIMQLYSPDGPRAEDIGSVELICLSPAFQAVPGRVCTWLTHSTRSSLSHSFPLSVVLGVFLSYFWIFCVLLPNVELMCLTFSGYIICLCTGPNHKRALFCSQFYYQHF